MARTVRLQRKLLEEVKEILDTDSDEDAITEALLRIVRRRRFDDFQKRIAHLENPELQEAWDREMPEIVKSLEST
jgi:predicted house-cleaning noncanonical NTP pyrophosphatase (MazG superfamily)